MPELNKIFSNYVLLVFHTYLFWILIPLPKNHTHLDKFPIAAEDANHIDKGIRTNDDAGSHGPDVLLPEIDLTAVYRTVCSRRCLLPPRTCRGIFRFFVPLYYIYTNRALCGFTASPNLEILGQKYSRLYYMHPKIVYFGWRNLGRRILIGYQN